MKVIIAGSRTIRNVRAIERAIKLSGFQITEVVSGGAPGPDRIGEHLARRMRVKVTRMSADWEKEGLAAGRICNTQMAQYAEALIAVWDGKSKGTEHMISEAKRLGRKVFILKVNEENKRGFNV